jgi:hypothetical protein
MDLWAGSAFAPTHPYATNLPIRFVVEQVFQIDVHPLNDRVAYLTASIPPVTPPLVTRMGANVFRTDYSRGDRVAIPSGAAPNYQILFTETVNYLGMGTYWRLHICPLPIP